MRSELKHAPLQRLLGSGPGAISASDHGADVAERLGAWLNVADAITLRTGLATVAAASLGKPMATAVSLEQELARVRATLTQAITALRAGPAPKANPRTFGGRPMTPAVAPPPLDPATEFTLLHQRYNELQRRMEMSVEALRTHARQVLTATSPALAKLAAVDALMAQVVSAREQNLLATIPTVLKRRFEVRRQVAAQAAAQDDVQDQTQDAASASSSAEAGRPDGAWLETLAAEFQQALLAELDLRLQAVVGMVQAHRHAQHAAALISPRAADARD